MAQELCIVRKYRSFIDSYNFTNNDIRILQSVVEIHTKQNFVISSALLRKQNILSKKFRPGNGNIGSYAKIFSPVAEIPVSPSD